MKKDMDDIKIIEKFLDGKMTAEEKAIFESKFKKDESFNKMVTDMNMLVEGIKSSAAQTTKYEKENRLKLYEKLNEIENEEKKIVPLYKKAWMLAAAASLILMASLAVYYVSEQTPRNEKLYTAYFEPFDSPGNGLTRGNNSATLKTEAYEAYDNGNYPEAAKLFEQLLQEKEDPIINLCLGNAYLAQNDPVRAEKIFTEMLTTHTELITQTKWYLALTYLKQNKIERTKAILWEISKSSTYGEKAIKLLNELD